MWVLKWECGPWELENVSCWVNGGVGRCELAGELGFAICVPLRKWFVLHQDFYL